MSTRPRQEHVYQNDFIDSTRWEKFTPRDDDVIVCTSYKAGTTWTQMICALMVHQTSELPAPLALLSPWLDARLTAIDEIVAGLEKQPHRRVIKTHTALDGLPFYDTVTYVMCGRDPRDVFMSLQNHLANVDTQTFGIALARQGIDLGEGPTPMPEDINERFKLWLNVGQFPWEQDGLPFWSHMRHAQTFWDHRDQPNLQFLHYADLKADLDGQMRRMAKILDVEIDEAKWPALVQAAGFDEMKSNADRMAPDTNHGIWLSNSQFFNKGSNEQWRDALSAESLATYQAVTRARYPAELMDWLERGSIATGDPKGR